MPRSSVVSRLLVAAGVVPLLVLAVGAVALPAAADTVVDGCVVGPATPQQGGTYCPNMDLAGADFSHLDLRHAVFSGSDLHGANTTGLTGQCG